MFVLMEDRKMLLYRYRTVENAIKEIENGTFHFASRKELNDPVEGYVRIYWKGDKAAWEGLFRNYICSTYHAMTMYLIAADEDTLFYNTIIIDIHKFDDVPLGKVYKNLGDKFLEDVDVQQLAKFYGKREMKVRCDELRLALQFVHSKALVICIKSCIECGVIPEDEGTKLLEIFEKREQSVLNEKIYQSFSDEVYEHFMVKYLKDVFEDMIEYQYIKNGLNNNAFLYGKTFGEKDENETARQRRKWLVVAVDFPKIYVEQMKELIYPEGFIVCFSGKNDDSAMWGKYANDHKGVCLIYETDEKQAIKIKLLNGFVSKNVKKVVYEGEVIERNFFESFGRLTYSQIKGWLTGSRGMSNCYEVFRNKEEWRKKYWDAFEAKNYRKLKDWEHEDEYRVVIDNTFYEYEKWESRNIQYELKSLKGIIFGINTAEYDKMCIMEKLLEKKDVFDDFTFYQAEYDDSKQKIVVRKKEFWKLSD